MNASTERRPTVGPRRRRWMARCLAILAGTAGLAAVPSAAMAYNTHNCHWYDNRPRTSVGIDMHLVAGPEARAALNQSTLHITQATTLEMWTTNDTSPAFKAENTNYGANGWEARASWNCFAGTMHGATAYMNEYYLGGASAERRRIVWLHELGHNIGFNHSGSNRVVMWETTVTPYYTYGVRYLTQDEINGINRFYPIQ